MRAVLVPDWQRRGVNLGWTVASAWMPLRYQRFGDRRWDTPYGQTPEPAPVTAPPASPVAINEVIEAFRRRGARAGLEAARRYGHAYIAGARRYLELRATTEERLAAEEARLNAIVARGAAPGSAPAVELAFVQARLREVRAARATNATPPQAVRDRPEVADHGIPRWVFYGTLTLAGASFLLALTRSARRS
jgi:hypothetical protein